MAEYKSNKQIATEVVRKFKDSPSLTLARKLVADYPERFYNLENARSTIRIVRGAVGKKNEHLATEKRDKGVPYNPYSLPPSDKKDWLPFEIFGYKKALILSDVHAPFHCVEALTLAIQKGKKEKVDCVIFNGDLADCHFLSKYEKDPCARSYSEERFVVIEIFKAIKKALPGVKIFWKLGNHEERLGIYLSINAPVFLDCPEFKYENFFKLDELGITLIDDKRIVKFGKMNIFHGHEFAGCPNSAKGLWMKVKTHCSMGHIHFYDEHTEQDIYGNTTSAYIMPTLGDLHPKFCRINKWKNGFSILSLTNDEGNYNFKNYKIINGDIY